MPMRHTILSLSFLVMLPFVAPSSQAKADFITVRMTTTLNQHLPTKDIALRWSSFAQLEEEIGLSTSISCNLMLPNPGQPLPTVPLSVNERLGYPPASTGSTGTGHSNSSPTPLAAGLLNDLPPPTDLTVGWLILADSPRSPLSSYSDLFHPPRLAN